MKCHILFSGKNKKNIISLSSAENAQRVVKVKAPVTTASDIITFLAHLSCRDKVSFCDHILSVVRHVCVRPSVHPSINNFFKRHLLLNH